ncbi:LamG domain-containing protein, partial [Candidatus Woesearchaeota archaeon]|nr:LamG domain-containing protein [Candidatus Woesearchaeota archaeon]
IFINTSENDAGNDHNDFSAFVDFNNSLVGYWRFEDGAGRNVTDFTSNALHGNMTNFAACLSLDCSVTSGWTSAGKRGRALKLDGVNDFVNLSNNPALSLDRVSVEVWFRRDGPGSGGWDGGIVSKYAPSVDSGVYNYYIRTAENNNYKIDFSVHNSTSGPCPVTSDTVTDTGRWYHVVGVANGTHAMTYVNGVLNGTSTCFIDTLAKDDSYALYAGSLQASSLFFNGSIDEVKVWNRALDAQEINASYRAGTYRLFRNFTGLNDGNYSYRAYSVDAAGNVNQSLVQNFTVDTVVPALSYAAPSTANASFVNVSWIFLNFSYTEIHNDTFMIRNGSTNWTNVNASAGFFFYNFTNLPDGNYTFFGWMNDSAGNVVQTVNRTVVVDTVPPAISFIANTPANASVLSSNFIFINTSENDAGNNHNDFSAFIDFNNSLVGYWRFEDDGDTNATDFTNYNNNGSLTGLGCTALDCNTASGWTSKGKRGKGMAFDGSNDVVTVRDNAALRLSNKWTISFWLENVNSVGSSGVLRKGAGNALGTGGYQIWTDGAKLYLKRDNQQQTMNLGVNNTFNFYAFTYDGTNNRFYRNGVLWSTWAQTWAANTDTSNLLFGQGDSNYLNGVLDEVAIYERTLSAIEINASYQAGVYRLSNNFTGLADGNYSYRAFVVDAAGSMNVTDNRTFTVDTTAPAISYVALTDANASFLNRSYTIVNISTTETSEHGVFVDFNGTLRGYWRFEDDGDTNASDFSSNNNNGTLVGFGCTAADCNLTGGIGGVASGFVSGGKRGKGLALDDLDDYVDVANSISFNSSSTMTWAAWVNPRDTNAEGIMFKRIGTTEYAQFALTLFQGTLYCLQSSDGLSWQTEPSTTVPAGSNNTWLYVACVNNGTHGLLYLNGNSTAVDATPATSVGGSTNSLWIGQARIASATSTFNGSIDDVMVWSRGLSAEEINASFQAGTYRHTKNFTGLNDGNYSYYAAVVDSAGTLVQTTNRTIYVDTVAPSISLVANTPANASVLGTNFIFINTSENDAGSNHNDFSAFVDFNSSLIGYWRFDEENPIIYDHSGNGRHANMSGFKCYSVNCNLTGSLGGVASGRISSGARGSGMAFDGNSTYANASVPASVLNVSNTFTISMWVNPRDFTTHTVNPRPISYRTSSSHGFTTAFNSAGTFVFRVINGGYTPSVTSQGLSANSWTHLAMVWNGSNVSLYVNGNSSGVFNANNPGLSGDFDTVYLGTRNTAAGFFNGSIDEVQIWNRVLSPEEINASFRAGNYRLFRNFTSLPDGNYTFRAYSVDAAGNVNQTAGQNITIDTVAPALSFIAPTDANSSFLNRTWTLVNVSTSEASEHSVFVNFNGTLRGYWRFEDDGDTNASDFSSNNNNGTLVAFSCTAADCNLTGAGFTSFGKRGKALKFDGNGSIVNVTNSPSLNITDSLTLEAWIFPHGQVSTAKIVYKSNDSEPTGYGLSYQQDETQSRQVSFFIGNGTKAWQDASNNYYAHCSSSLPVNSWSYVAATTSAGLSSIYVDGQLCNVSNYTGSIAPNDFPLYIGGHVFTPTSRQMFNGSVDEVRVWSRALNHSEINASFKAGTYRYSKNFTGLNDGNYSYLAYVVDSAGILINTTNRTIFVDTRGPGLTFEASSFLNRTNNKYSSLNVTQNDSGNDHNELSAFVDFNSSVIGYWRFEDDGDTAASDFTAFNSHGTLVNFGCAELNCNLTGGLAGVASGWTSAGKRGKALAFDRSGSYVDAGNSSAFNADNLTVEAWVYLRSYPVGDDAQMSVVSKHNDSPGANQRSWIIYISQNGLANWWADQDGTNTNVMLTSSTGAIPLDSWHHVAGTFAPGSTGILYVDGIKYASAGTLTRIFDSVSPVRIGADASTLVVNSTTRGFNGSIDEVRISSRVLSEDEINASFRAGRYRLLANISGGNRPDGNYTYAAYVVDAAGNINKTEDRVAIIDNTVPAIAAIRTVSNSSPHFYQVSNSTSAVVAYFNSIAPATTGDGGGGQAVTFEVVYTDLYRNSLAGNLTFGSGRTRRG